MPEKPEPLIEGVSDKTIESNRLEIKITALLRRRDRTQQMEAQQQREREMLFFPRALLSQKRSDGAEYYSYSKEERDAVIRHGFQIPSPRISEIEYRSNCRVILMQRAVDLHDENALYRVLFKRDLKDESSFDLRALVRETIRYCIDRKCHSLLSPVLSQFLFTLQDSNVSTYNQEMQQLASFMQCNSRGFEKIAPLFSYINRLSWVVDHLKKFQSQESTVVTHADNSLKILQMQSMKFFIEIIEPVSNESVDMAFQSLANECMASIQVALNSSSSASLSFSLFITPLYNELNAFFNFVTHLSVEHSEEASAESIRDESGVGLNSCITMGR